MDQDVVHGEDTLPPNPMERDSDGKKIAMMGHWARRTLTEESAGSSASDAVSQSDAYQFYGVPGLGIAGLPDPVPDAATFSPTNSPSTPAPTVLASSSSSTPTRQEGDDELLYGVYGVELGGLPDQVPAAHAPAATLSPSTSAPTTSASSSSPTPTRQEGEDEDVLYGVYGVELGGLPDQVPEAPTPSATLSPSTPAPTTSATTTSPAPARTGEDGDDEHPLRDVWCGAWWAA